jgi:hypothetical protein
LSHLFCLVDWYLTLHREARGSVRIKGSNPGLHMSRARVLVHKERKAVIGIGRLVGEAAILKVHTAKTNRSGEGWGIAPARAGATGDARMGILHHDISSQRVDSSSCCGGREHFRWPKTRRKRGFRRGKNKKH